MLSLFTKKAPNRVFLAMLLGVLAGFGVAMVIPLLMNVIKPTPGGLVPQTSSSLFVFNWEVSDAQFAILFFAICVFTFVARTISQVILIRVAVAVTTDLRAKIYRSISDAPMSAVESTGPSRLMAALTADVPRIVAGARLLPEILTSSMTLIGLFAFLYYLNADVFQFVLICILAGVATYQLPMVLGRRYLVKARHHLDGLHEGIRGLVYGNKELKLSNTKRKAYFDQVLMRSEREVRHAQKVGQSILRVAMNYGSLLSFFIIGSVSFVVINHSSLSKSELVGVIMVLLYVSGPVGMLLGFIPQLMSARISYRKLDRLLAGLPSEQINPMVIEPLGWEAITFEAVRYQHVGRDKAVSFDLGPVDFEIRKREITFIIGGNGSGKSTLGKLLSLHYHTTDGVIRFGGTVVDSDTVTTFRQSICAIYSDYYLFSRLLVLSSTRMTEKVNHYLRVLELDRKVSLDQGEFSTLDLSDGQRRRLALLVAFVEDRDLYVFDEWAADQDPRFKLVFYREILPELKMQGKAVVVISHDDRYFDLADKVIHMEDGKIREVTLQESSSAVVLPLGQAPRIVLR